jgi:hypothetical protein
VIEQFRVSALRLERLDPAGERRRGRLDTLRDLVRSVASLPADEVEAVVAVLARVGRVTARRSPYHAGCATAALEAACAHLEAVEHPQDRLPFVTWVRVAVLDAELDGVT